MAKAKQVRLCHSCHTELIAEEIGQCPSCGVLLKMPEGLGFEPPDYLYLQRQDIDTAVKKEKYAQQKEDAAFRNTARELLIWCRTCPDEMRLGALSDALLILQNLLHSNASPETVKLVAKLGKSIGEISTAINQYMISGGRLHGVLRETPTAERDLDNEET